MAAIDIGHDTGQEAHDLELLDLLHARIARVEEQAVDAIREMTAELAALRKAIDSRP